MRFPMIIAAGALAALPAFANDYAPKMQDFLDGEVRKWAGSRVLIDAVRAQNEVSAAYSQDQIEELDQAWRRELGLSQRPTIEPVISNAASEFLRRVVADAGGVLTEVFVMDARGLNVAASGPTSDYWQGDEAKFSETYPNGPAAVHLSEIEFDESSQTYQGQISFSVVDPVSNEVIGAMTVGVNAESLF